MKLINRQQGGSLEINQKVMNALSKKHPNPLVAHSDILLSSDDATASAGSCVEEPIYEGINLEMVQKAARNTFGCVGPSKVDADIWKEMLCSKKLSPQCEQLSYQYKIALLGRIFSKRFVDPAPLQEILACRLIPLDKKPQSEQLKIRPMYRSWRNTL